MLVGFLTSNPVVNKYGKPVAIFATKTTKDDDGHATGNVTGLVLVQNGARQRAPKAR
jgi:hypothetical protein